MVFLVLAVLEVRVTATSNVTTSFVDVRAPVAGINCSKPVEVVIFEAPTTVHYSVDLEFILVVIKMILYSGNQVHVA